MPEVAAQIFRYQDAKVTLKIGYAKEGFSKVVNFEYRKIKSSGRFLCRFKEGWKLIAEELRLDQGDTITFSRDATKPSMLHVSVKRPGEIPEIIEIKDEDEDDYDSDFSLISF